MPAVSPGHAGPGDAAIGLIRDFLTFLAKMGLTVRDDPKKVVDIAGRTWGEPAGGLALSMRLRTKEDEDELPAVSVAIHNRTGETQRLTTRGWLNFFHVSVVSADGVVAGLTPYGGQLMQPERQPAPSEVALTPGEAIEADIPIGSIFEMPKGLYRVYATCEAPGGRLVTSNEVQIQV